MFIIMDMDKERIDSQDFVVESEYIVKEIYMSKIPKFLPRMPTKWDFLKYHAAPSDWATEPAPHPPAHRAADAPTLSGPVAATLGPPHATALAPPDAATECPPDAPAVGPPDASAVAAADASAVAVANFAAVSDSHAST